jgi:hypothetical protein
MHVEAVGLAENIASSEEVVLLPNTARLRIRTLRRGDEAPIRELDKHLGTQSRYQRFG